MQHRVLNCQLIYWTEGISVVSVRWNVSTDLHTWLLSSEIIFNKLLSLENKQPGQCMVHLEYWENKQAGMRLLVFAGLFGVCAPETWLSSPEQKFWSRVQLFVWHFWATLLPKKHSDGWLRSLTSNTRAHSPAALPSADSESGSGHREPSSLWSLCHTHDFSRAQRWGKKGTIFISHQ